MRADPTLLRPTNEPAPRAVLCDDPATALALAQLLVDGPLMFNHARGLWGYVGVAPDGERLLIQSTGVGGPCAALVLADLAGVGVERAVRVGTGWGAHPDGAFVAVRADGADPVLSAALTALADATAGVESFDVPVRDRPLADLETAALLRVAARDGLALAVGLVVAGDLDDDLLARAHARAGLLARDVLAA